MNKREARNMLNEYIRSQPDFTLPIVDVTIERRVLNIDGVFIFDSYSLIGLIKIAYNLK